MSDARPRRGARPGATRVPRSHRTRCTSRPISPAPSPCSSRLCSSGTEISLHLKLPGKLSLDEAHAVAEDVERAILSALPEVSSVQTHLEPLAEEAAGTRPPAADVAGERELVARIVRDAIGGDP